MFKTVIIILIAIVFVFTFKDNIEGFENRRIPKIIIQTWKDENIPDKYKSCIESVKKFNSNYEYKFFTDRQIEEFLQKHYPEYLNIYKRLPVKIQRIDFFRYIAVYHYGGFYLDLDMTVTKSFDSLLRYKCIFPIDQHIERKCKMKRYRKFCDAKMDFLIGQYAFGAVKGDKFLKKLIDGIIGNIEEYESYRDNGDRGIKFKRYVYDSTGPDYVTRVFMDNKNLVKILESGKDQYFGDYAVHNFFGTWK